jgi:hypothetical protein
MELLCLRRGGPLEGLAAELSRREAFLRTTTESGVLGIPEVRGAIAEFRGEAAPMYVRGDPTQ